MNESIYADPFATKGIEYLLVIAFLMALVLFWRYLNKPMATMARAIGSSGLAPSHWFHIPENLHYHPGHTWAVPEPGGLLRVGMDDFAQKLLGEARRVVLPEVGQRVEAGGSGWMLEVGTKSIPVLSPAGGEVVARNEEALRSPGLINRDPYGQGWLIKVRASNLKSNLRSLLRGELARAWTAMTERDLRQRSSLQLGAVLQDGGFPVSGIAKELDPDSWEEIAREFLLTK